MGYVIPARANLWQVWRASRGRLGESGLSRCCCCCCWCCCCCCCCCVAGLGRLFVLVSSRVSLKRAGRTPEYVPLSRLYVLARKFPGWRTSGTSYLCVRSMITSEHYRSQVNKYGSKATSRKVLVVQSGISRPLVGILWHSHASTSSWTSSSGRSRRGVIRVAIRNLRLIQSVALPTDGN